jgi:excisionase family DNA binding protein
MDDDTITQAEAARLLGVTRARVEQMLDSGVLPVVVVSVRMRRVRRADVEALRQQERASGRHRSAASDQPE